MAGAKIVFECRLGGRAMRVAVSPLEWEMLRTLPPEIAIGRLLESRGHPGAASLVQEASRARRLRLAVKREVERGDQEEGAT